MAENKNIMGDYHNLSRKDKFKIIISYLGEEVLEFCSQQNYSYGMLRDKILRDYPQIKEDKRVRKVVASLQNFRNAFKDGGYKFCLEKYNKMPQSWKLQYRFPKEFTVKQIEKEISNKCRESQKDTVLKRKENNSYKNQKFDRLNSPLCIEFYTTRGFDEEYAKKRVKSICSSGAKAALKVVQSPSTEKKIEEILLNNDFNFTTQFVVHNKKGEDYDKRKAFIYDFLLPETKTIIEVHGDFFHGNPCYYKPEDLVPLPGGQIAAKEIWAKDRKKIDYAKELGYNVVVVWEKDINNNISKCKEQILNG